VYSLKEEKCLAMIGERCKFGFDEDDHEAQRLWYEKLNCVPNAECGSSGLCHCLPGFYEDANATSCHPVKLRGTPCVNDFECNQDHLLTCINNSCQCDPKKSIYIADTPKPWSSGGLGRCMGKVGSTCTSSEDDYCIPDAHCEYDGTRGNICKCKNPLEPTSNGQCGVPYGHPCLNHWNKRKVCIDSLVCLTFPQSVSYSISSCSCPDASYQEFDSKTSICRSIAGSPCNPEQEVPCTHMAKCVENQNSGLFLCECDDGHVETSRGTCQKAHGQTCSYGQGKEIPNHERCDEKAGLDCLKGSCSCQDASNVYENGRRQCSRPVGVTCTEASQCVANAFCDKFQGEGLSGRCKCLKDYHHVSRNRECVSDIDLTEDFVEGNSTTTKVP
jgi:hypothetical protein